MLLKIFYSRPSPKLLLGRGLSHKARLRFREVVFRNYPANLGYKGKEPWQEPTTDRGKKDSNASTEWICGLLRDSKNINQCPITTQTFFLGLWPMLSPQSSWDLMTNRMPEASLQKYYHWPFTLLPSPPSANSVCDHFIFLFFSSTVDPVTNNKGMCTLLRPISTQSNRPLVADEPQNGEV